MDLPSPLLELLLARLPLRSALSACSVCKPWLSLISSPYFSQLHSSILPANRSPWFFLSGINHLLPSKSQTFCFDPILRSWIRLPFCSPPPHNQSSLSAMNGIVFGLVGAKQSQLCLAACPFKPNWTITASMECSRYAPLVGMLGNPDSSYKIIVAGGVDDDEDRQAVEMYDGATNRWERCPSLPNAFSGQNSRQMSSAVCKGKYYVADSRGENLSAFDLGEKAWKSWRYKKPQGLINCYLVGCEEGLVMVGLCNAGEGSCVKIWKVEESTMEVKEVSRMPRELFELFCDGEEKQVEVKISGGGNVVYVYSDSQFKDYAVCLCEMRKDGTCIWTKLPALPAPVNRFDRVVCVSSVVPLDACFPSKS